MSTKIRGPDGFNGFIMRKGNAHAHHAAVGAMFPTSGNTDEPEATRLIM